MTFNSKRYTHEFLTAMGVYSAAILGTRWLIERGEFSDGLVIALALVPIAPAVAAVFVIMRHIKTMDELHKRVLIEAFAGAGLLVGLVTFSLGLVEGEAFERVSMVWVLPAVMASWGALIFIMKRRYFG